jgi:hypothetical protein
VHPDLDHVYDEVGPFERVPQVEMLLDPGASAELPGSPAGHHAGGFQTFGVYVVEGDGRPVQLGKAQDIREEVPGEDDAPGADESYPGYGNVPLWC